LSRLETYTPRLIKKALWQTASLQQPTFVVADPGLPPSLEASAGLGASLVEAS